MSQGGRWREVERKHDESTPDNYMAAEAASERRWCEERQVQTEAGKVEREGGGRITKMCIGRGGKRTAMVR